MKLRVTLWIAFLLFAVHAYAEVKLVREYLLKEPRDRRIIFAMAVTPERDVLSVVANVDGTWRLSRVRHWLDPQPMEESLTLPGLVQGGRKGWSGWGSWSQQMSITPDGKFALCIVSALHDRERQDLVSIVSLSPFEIVLSMRPSALAELSGTFRSYRLDRRGYLVVDASTPFPRHPGDDPFFGGNSHRLATLAIPGLSLTGSCEYSEWMRSGSVVRREDESNCAGLLQNAGVTSLDEISKTLNETEEVTQTNQARPAACAFLTYMSHTSSDGRLRRELCSGGHRGFFGNFVATGVRENIFSELTGQQLGFIKEPDDHPLQSRFATLDGKDYLLVMEGGTRLWVYRISP